MELKPPSAPVSQIFSGIQGEGSRVGLRTLFFRLRGCNWNCLYCDTDSSLDGKARIEIEPGSRCFKERANPLSVSEASDALSSLYRPSSGAVDLAVTGGEPLLYPSFLKALLSGWPDSGLPRPHVLLETNGTLPEALEETFPLWDTVSMDIKLQSATGQPTPWDLHGRFLDKLREAPNTIIKLVVVHDTDLQELLQAVELLRLAGLKCPEIVLQPVTVGEGWPLKLDCPPPPQLLSMMELFAEQGFTCRVIPQTHKFLGDL